MNEVKNVLMIFGVT